MASLVIRSAGSGEVLAELDADDFQRMVGARGNAVKALKLELKDQGFGGRFRLRLLTDSAVEIPDDEILVPPLDLKLVRLNLCPFDKADTEALLRASREGRLEEVETRLKKPQDPNATTITIGLTSLHFAAGNGHLECVRLLMEAAADCDQVYRGKTPLHDAACRGHVEVVRLLVEAGASLNQQNGVGFTALHFGAKNGHTEVVHLLLKARALCNLAGGRQAETPLHVAAMRGHTEVVRLLLEAGAPCDAHMKNDLLQFAARNGDFGIFHLLEATSPREKRRKVTAT